MTTMPMDVTTTTAITILMAFFNNSFVYIHLLLLLFAFFFPPFPYYLRILFKKPFILFIHTFFSLVIAFTIPSIFREKERASFVSLVYYDDGLTMMFQSVNEKNRVVKKKYKKK